jgi:hypothetical protein
MHSIFHARTRAPQVLGVVAERERAPVLTDVIEPPETTAAQAITVAVIGLGYVGLPLVIRNGCFVDVKSVCDRDALTACGLHVWRL